MSEAPMRRRTFPPEFEDAFERFAIMTVDGHASDQDAVAYVAAEFGFGVAMDLMDYLRKKKMNIC